MEKKHGIKKKILKIVIIALIAIIPLCFLYSLIQLIIQPVKVCVVENGKIYDEESATRLYNKGRKNINTEKIIKMVL